MLVLISDPGQGGAGFQVSAENQEGHIGQLGLLETEETRFAVLDGFPDYVTHSEFGYFLASLSQGFVAAPPGSQGNLCLGGQIGRFNQHVLGSGPQGDFALEVDTTALPVFPIVAIVPGDTWHFQAWFRDVNPTPTSNFTDGLSIEYE